MSVRVSVCQPRLGGNVILSEPNLDRGLISSSFATYGCCHPCLLILGRWYSTCISLPIVIREIDNGFDSRTKLRHS